MIEFKEVSLSGAIEAYELFERSRPRERPLDSGAIVNGLSNEPYCSAIALSDTPENEMISGCCAVVVPLGQVIVPSIVCGENALGSKEEAATVDEGCGDALEEFWSTTGG